MASVKLILSDEIASTSIPNVFIDEYMTCANPAYAVVYIYGYRQSLTPNGEISTESLSEKLNILESDVLKAWRYWEKEGLIKITDEDDDFSIEYLRINGKKKSARSDENRSKDSTEQSMYDKNVMPDRPQYTREELDVYKTQSSEIQRLFKAGETVLGKYLNYNDMNILFGLYDWLRLPVDVIELLMLHCAENDHKNIRYIERVAMDWAEKAVDTTEKARAYIEKSSDENKDFREILKAFGHRDREATQTEIKYMKKWLNEYKMPLDIIFEACDRTIMNTGKSSFKYADTILTNWKDGDARTMEAIKLIDGSRTKDAPADKTPEKTKTNRFVNFAQREIDFDELEKQEMEYLRRSVKEK